MAPASTIGSSGTSATTFSTGSVATTTLTAKRARTRCTAEPATTLTSSTRRATSWFEVANAGYDLVLAQTSFALPDNVEALQLVAAAGASNGVGNDLGNVILGNDSDNTLWGNGGNDQIDGHGGDDTMFGGVGDDHYYVRQAGDVVSENAFEGIDTVYAYIDYTLPDHLEQLYLHGPGPLQGSGNSLDNFLAGNDDDNTLYGYDGNDELRGSRRQ